MVAALAITFSASGVMGVTTPMSAQVGFSFGVSSSSFNLLRAMSATPTITFGIDATLHLIGHAIIVSAVPTSYVLRASQSDYSAKALPSSYILRGAK